MMGSSTSVLIILAVVVVVAFIARPAAANPGEKAASAKWLEEKAGESGINRLPSGMLFRVLTKGTGSKSPTVSDPCEVHYEGRLRNGKVFDSSYKRGAPLTFAPNQVIKGWTEALQLMREGDIWEVYIPSELGYGARGAGSDIPGHAALTFKMELIKVKGKGKDAADCDREIAEKVGKPYAEL
jgi:FKBP-type peptidyl-prolyl cis-trans isomerase FklB